MNEENQNQVMRLEQMMLLNGLKEAVFPVMSSSIEIRLKLGKILNDLLDNRTVFGLLVFYREVCSNLSILPPTFF